MQSVTTGMTKPAHKCFVCNKQFTKKCNLYAHMRNAHRIEPDINKGSIACGDCDAKVQINKTCINTFETFTNTIWCKSDERIKMICMQRHINRSITIAMLETNISCVLLAHFHLNRKQIATNIWKNTRSFRCSTAKHVTNHSKVKHATNFTRNTVRVKLVKDLTLMNNQAMMDIFVRMLVRWTQFTLTDINLGIQKPI